MKHLTTLLTMAITLTGLAQQMPYNPDANGDDFVGVDDVLGVLGVYDTALMQPDLQCDYEGTDLEQLLAGITDGSLILDSVYVEYLLVDSATTYYPGCPDPVTIETVLERSYTMPTAIQGGQDGASTYCYTNLSYLGEQRQWILYWSPVTGGYRMWLKDEEFVGITSYDRNSYWAPQTQNLPFPEDYILNSDGIQVNWDSQSWAANCEHLRVIPFWHEAE